MIISKQRLIRAENNFREAAYFSVNTTDEKLGKNNNLRQPYEGVVRGGGNGGKPGWEEWGGRGGWREGGGGKLVDKVRGWGFRLVEQRGGVKSRW